MGKEFKNSDVEGIFAGTPPLEAPRRIAHEETTMSSGVNINTKVIMVNDVSRAFFEAPAMRQVCVELPSEEFTSLDSSWIMLATYKLACTGRATPP